MKVANFLVIANKRCGTSWLNRNLAEHPEIFMTEKKGVHFFDKDYDKGLSFYEKYFVDAKDEKWRGETEHSYFWNDLVPQRIYESLGVIPLILSLRQPVDRAYSFFQLQNRLKDRPDDDFESFFVKAWGDNHRMVGWGKYGQQLEKYLKFFPLEKMHIIKFEDIKARPEQTIQEVYRFLEVDDKFVSSWVTHKWTPATNLPKDLSSFKKKMFYTSSAAIMARSVLRKLGFKVAVYRKFSPPPLGRELKKKLTVYFDKDIRLLMELTNVDFSSWLSESL